MLNQPKFLKFEDIPVTPRKVHDVAGVFKFGTTNRFHSSQSAKALSELRPIEEHLGSTLEQANFVEFSLKLHFSAFSRYYFSADLIRLLKMLERTIRIRFSLTSYFFEGYFNEAEKTLDVRYFYLNFDLKTDARSLYSHISQELLSGLESSLSSKFTHFDGVSMDLKKLKAPIEVSDVYTPTEPSDVSLQGKAIFELTVLLADPNYQKAVSRALKSLNVERASKLLDALNGLIEVNGDEFIHQLTLPKKFSKQNSGVLNAKNDESLVDDVDFLFTNS